MSIDSFEQFILMLEELSLPDNTIRSNAEIKYENLRQLSGDSLSLSLLSVLLNPTVIKPHLQILAAVLLRRILVQQEPSAYRGMSPNGQASLRHDLIVLISTITEPNLKAKVSDLVGDFAGFILEPEEWPEIMQYTYQSLQSTNHLDRETGLQLLGMLSHNASHILCSSNNIHVIINIFQQCLIDSSDQGKVILSAIRALSILLMNISLESDRDNFQSLLEPIMRGFMTIINQSKTNEEYIMLACTYSESLIDLAEECSNFFSIEIKSIFEVIMSILEIQTLHSSIRHLTLEFIVTLCSNNTKKIRKITDETGQKGYFVRRLFPLLTTMMTIIPEDSKWTQADYAEESIEGAMDTDVAETALDRLCVSLGLRSTWTVISSIISSLLSSTTSWQSIHTGLRLLGNYLEVSKSISIKSQLNEHHKDVVINIQRFIQFNHPRIRAAAFYTCSQLFLTHGDKLSKELITTLLPLILQSLLAENNPAPRVRRSVLLSLMNLIDNSSANVLEPYTGMILEHISKALIEGPIFIQEMCVTAIASLAETGLLVHAKQSKQDVLWAQTMECCAMVGEVSGKEKFHSDALEMLTYLRRDPSSSSLTSSSNGDLDVMMMSLDDDIETRKLLTKAWVRIARCLGSDFLPYLPVVMELLLTAVSQDTIAHDVDCSNDDDIDARSDIEMVEGEDGWVAVRTAAVEEQASACQLIMLLIEKLQEHYYPYIDATLKVIHPLIASPHEDVRSFAIVSLPEFVRAAGKATAPDRSPIQSLAIVVMHWLTDAIQKESTMVLIMTGLQSLKTLIHYSCVDWSTSHSWVSSSSVSVSGEPPAATPSNSISWMNADQLREVSECAQTLLRESLQRRAVLRAEAQVSGELDDDDAADEDMFMSESLELHYNISELIGILLRTHSDVYMSIYSNGDGSGGTTNGWHECISNMSHSYCLKQDRQFSLFVISDVIEFGIHNESMADSYLRDVMPRLLEGSVVPEANIRQTCAYMFGVIAKKFPSSFIPYAQSVLMSLARSISMGEEPDEPRGQATDNAVASVGLILEQMGGRGVNLGLDYNVLWSQWLSYLPLRHDEEEGCNVMKQLSRLLIQRHQILFQSNDNVISSLKVVLKTINEENLIPENIRNDLIIALHSIFRGDRNSIVDNIQNQLLQSIDSNLAKVFELAMNIDISHLTSSSSLGGQEFPLGSLLTPTINDISYSLDPHRK
eukprot:gene4290-8528_t